MVNAVFCSQEGKVICVLGCYVSWTEYHLKEEMWTNSAVNGPSGRGWDYIPFTASVSVFKVSLNARVPVSIISLSLETMINTGGFSVTHSPSVCGDHVFLFARATKDPKKKEKEKNKSMFYQVASVFVLCHMSLDTVWRIRSDDHCQGNNKSRVRWREYDEKNKTKKQECEDNERETLFTAL